ncbi:hypothetical protein HOT95_gp055 [Vibrio phage vB_VpS_PG07]|uniref:Uncharacterized protein n=1 Tax=Vibrio phage vB_VpS_PG07 TaxID=2301664 RepID=A0A385E4H9_9CAUD|nr:hypothetical protein HOT95_gp055 [Vibrio phage vB_VpS_PG07]AXQ66680.1 hypothetical protein [Vibrio phage vB_VpS_PG07]
MSSKDPVNIDTICRILEELHPSHYDSVILSCRSGAPHSLLPEIDFSDRETSVYVESFLTIKKTINCQSGRISV